MDSTQKSTERWTSKESIYSIDPIAPPVWNFSTPYQGKNSSIRKARRPMWKSEVERVDLMKFDQGCRWLH